MNAMATAARCGNLRILQWLFEWYPAVQPIIYIPLMAVGGGHRSVLEWVFSYIKTQRMTLDGW